MDINSSLNIFASGLHAHNAATSLRARHIDIDGNEYPYIDVNWNYDFNYQQSNMLNEGIIFNYGDSIILECYYQTMDKSNWTYGGEATTDEMCMMFLYVYPKPYTRYCASSFIKQDVDKWFNDSISKGYLNQDIWYYNTSMEGAIEHYQSLWYNYTLRLQICNGQDFTQSIITIPVINEEYIDPHSCDDYYQNITLLTSTSTPIEQSTTTTTTTSSSSTTTTSTTTSTSSTSTTSSSSTTTSSPLTTLSSTTLSTTSTTSSTTNNNNTHQNDAQSNVFYYSTFNINIIMLLIFAKLII
jgi:hypothetical protein